MEAELRAIVTAGVGIETVEARLASIEERVLALSNHVGLNFGRKK
jgi:hypothetical protein